MTTPLASRTTHEGVHSERGAHRGERPDRARNPLIKVEDLAWLEFEKPDLDRAERFAHDFGFDTLARTADELHLRGTRAGTHCMVIRRGPGSRFVAPAFRAAAGVSPSICVVRPSTSLIESPSPPVVQPVPPCGRFASPYR